MLNVFNEKNKDQVFTFLDLPQIHSLIYRTRTKEFHDWEGRIESFPLACTSKTDQRSFMRFKLVIEVDGKLCKLIGWCHPDLLFMLKSENISIFVDCTFKCVPWGFRQLMVIMMYSRAHDCYLPTWFILLPGKAEILYHEALRAAVWQTDPVKRKLSIKSKMTDFEHGLINAAAAQLPGGDNLGCFFHFKQALTLSRTAGPVGPLAGQLGPQNELSLTIFIGA